MKVFKKALMVSLIASAVSGNVMAGDEDITLLGLDNNGNEIEMPVKSKRFKKRVNKILKAYLGEAIPALDRAIRSDSKLKLREVDLGVSVKMGFEVPEVFDASVEPGIYVKLGN
ncbi:MAG: hypothetical protein OEY33_00175 [Bdellovibrionales bacterium]|nr:hypothetical protein [Bdellovibrionales bacterium]